MSEATFIHDHHDFDALLSIVSGRLDLSTGLVEKDYWVTHTLWALEATGFQVWFKGGTSLSKGFGVIERFSEDLDVKVDSPDLPEIQNWKSEEKGPSRVRRDFFEALREHLRIPGAEVRELAHLRDRSWRSAVFAVQYPSRFAENLPVGVRPFIQLDVGSARVTPSEERGITSWIHDHLDAESPEVAVDTLDNRPRQIRCVRPEVTLLEKIEAIARRYSRDRFEPGSFVRHYEDVARLLTSGALLPDDQLRSLLAKMRTAAEIREWPGERHPAFNCDTDVGRWIELEASWHALAPLFWGERTPIRACAEEIRNLLRTLGSTP